MPGHVEESAHGIDDELDLARHLVRHPIVAVVVDQEIPVGLQKRAVLVQRQDDSRTGGLEERPPVVAARSGPVRAEHPHQLLGGAADLRDQILVAARHDQRVVARVVDERIAVGPVVRAAAGGAVPPVPARVVERLAAARVQVEQGPVRVEQIEEVDPVHDLPVTGHLDELVADDATGRAVRAVAPLEPRDVAQLGEERDQMAVRELDGVVVRRAVHRRVHPEVVDVEGVDLAPQQIDLRDRVGEIEDVTVRELAHPTDGNEGIARRGQRVLVVPDHVAGGVDGVDAAVRGQSHPRGGEEREPRLHGRGLRRRHLNRRRAEAGDLGERSWPMGDRWPSHGLRAGGGLRGERVGHARAQPDDRHGVRGRGDRREHTARRHGPGALGSGDLEERRRRHRALERDQRAQVVPRIDRHHGRAEHEIREPVVPRVHSSAEEQQLDAVDTGRLVGRQARHHGRVRPRHDRDRLAVVEHRRAGTRGGLETGAVDGEEIARRAHRRMQPDHGGASRREQRPDHHPAHATTRHAPHPASTTRHTRAIAPLGGT